MTRHRLVEQLRRRAGALRFRFLKRVHRRGMRQWWTFERSAVARGVAVGLFAGVVTPVAQILFALPIAIALRANVLAAAASTFATNPFTLPFVYYYAYQIGSSLTERRADLADDVAVSEEAADQALDVSAWYSTLLEWAASIAFPFVLGLVFLALLAALLGYLLVHAVWGVYDAVRRYRNAQSNA